MSKGVSRQVRRGAIHGWIWYLPALGAVLGVLAFDTYVNVETRRNDYEIAKLRTRARELDDELVRLRSSRAEQEQLHRLVEHAEALGLRKAGPGEIIHVAAGFADTAPYATTAPATLAPLEPDTAPYRGASPLPEPQEPALAATAPAAAPKPAPVSVPAIPAPAAYTLDLEPAGDAEMRALGLEGIDPEPEPTNLDESMDSMLESL